VLEIVTLFLFCYFPLMSPWCEQHHSMSFPFSGDLLERVYYSILKYPQVYGSKKIAKGWMRTPSCQVLHNLPVTEYLPMSSVTTGSSWILPRELIVQLKESTRSCQTGEVPGLQTRVSMGCLPS
jgi:hypothetical protein